MKTQALKYLLSVALVWSLFVAACLKEKPSDVRDSQTIQTAAEPHTNKTHAQLYRLIKPGMTRVEVENLLIGMPRFTNRNGVIEYGEIKLKPYQSPRTWGSILIVYRNSIVQEKHFSGEEE
jgi:hypothetical protein